MASIAPKEVGGMVKTPLVLLRRYGPHPAGEAAWFEVKHAARMIRDGDARKATPEDFERDVFENKPKPVEKVAEKVEAIYSIDDFNNAMEAAAKAVGNKRKWTKVLSIYEIEIDGRKRKQEETRVAMEVFKAFSTADDFPSAPPVIPAHVKKADLKAEFVADWKKAFKIE